MLPERLPRLPASQVLRLLAAAPFVGTGLSLMAGSLLVSVGLFCVVGSLFAGAVYAFSLLLAPAAADLVGVMLLGVFTVGVLGYWALQFRQALWNGYRVEPADLVARTRTPEGSAERRVRTVVERLCFAVDAPTPAVRVNEVEEPICFTVRYPVETPPEEVLESNVHLYQNWSADDSHPDTDWDADEPIPEEYVLVVSTALLETVTHRELTVVLAHEVAHVKNRDLGLVNGLLLPIYWFSHSVWKSSLVVLHAYVGMVAVYVTLPGVAVFTRGRELRADAAAARITGDPAALASALERVADEDDRPEADFRCVSVLNVFSPGSDESGWLSRAAHPPVERRIDRLRSMADRLES